MADVVEEFTDQLKRDFDDELGQGGFAAALFGKINDAVTLHEFLKEEHSQRFREFYVDFMRSNPAGARLDDADVVQLMDGVIGDIAADWFKEEMLDWNFAEKLIFLNFVWICKKFRDTQALLFAEEQERIRRDREQYKRDLESEEDEGDRDRGIKVARCA